MDTNDDNYDFRLIPFRPKEGKLRQHTLERADTHHSEREKEKAEEAAVKSKGRPRIRASTYLGPTS